MRRKNKVVEIDAGVKITPKVRIRPRLCCPELLHLPASSGLLGFYNIGLDGSTQIGYGLVKLI